jgi:hypothetical protein
LPYPGTGNGGSVGPVRHPAREQGIHDRRVVVGQIVVDRAGRDRITFILFDAVANSNSSPALEWTTRIVPISR